MMSSAYSTHTEHIVDFSSRGVSHEILLQEIQDLRQKVNASNQVASLRDSEKQFWQQLVDSNIRAGTIACVWCIKAQLFKKLSASFNKWKLFAALKAMAEQRSGSSMMVVSEPKAADAVGDAINLLNRYKETESNLITRIVNGGNLQNITFPWQDRRVEQFDEEDTSILRDSLDPHPASTHNNSNYKHEPSITIEHHSYTPDEAMQEYEHQYSGFVRLSNTLLDKDTDPETKRKLLLTMSKDILSRSSNYGNSSTDNQSQPQPSSQTSTIGGRESWNTFNNRRNGTGEANLFNVREQDRQSHSSDLIDELSASRDQAASTSASLHHSQSYTFAHMNNNLIPAPVDVVQRSSLHLLKGSHCSSNSRALSPHYMQPRNIDVNQRFKPPVVYKPPIINDESNQNSCTSPHSFMFDYQSQLSPFHGTNPLQYAQQVQQAQRQQQKQYRQRGASKSPTGRRAVQQQEDDAPSYLKFRHGATGDFVRQLISPKSDSFAAGFNNSNNQGRGRRFFGDEANDQLHYPDTYQQPQQRHHHPESNQQQEEYYSRQQYPDINVRRGSHSDASSFISNPGRYYDYQPSHSSSRDGYDPRSFPPSSSRGQQQQPRPYEYDRSVSDINQRSLRSRSGSPNDLPRYLAVTSSYRKKTRAGTSPYKQSGREPREQVPRRSTSRNGRGSSVPPSHQQQQQQQQQQQPCSQQTIEASTERPRVSSGNSIASSGVDSKIAHNPSTSRPRSSSNNYSGGGGQGRVSTVPAPPGYIDMSVRDYHDRRELQRSSTTRGDNDYDNQSRASTVLTKESLVDQSSHLMMKGTVASEQSQQQVVSPELDPTGSSVRHKLPPRRGSSANQSIGATKMESAQRRLLFGDLDDVAGTNRGWQTILRR